MNPQNSPENYSNIFSSFQRVSGLNAKYIVYASLGSCIEGLPLFYLVFLIIIYFIKST